MESNVSYIKEVIEHILELLGEDSYELNVLFNEERNIYEVLITGENLGNLIGNHGEVSAAFQDLVNLIARKQKNLEHPVLFDIGGYKKVREEKLLQLAKDVAEKVISSNYPYKLRPMNSYERRIIHSEISKYPSLVSYSIGEGKDRRVVIEKSEV